MSEFIDDYSTAEYEYNINGLRESKTVNGVKTRYIYNDADIIGEIFDDNIYTYYRATELIGYTNNKGDIYHYRQNSHGDVTALLTVDGQEKKTYSYNAYGKENPFILNPMGNQTAILQWRAETEQTHNPFRYAGEYYDQETGLTYLRNRYYDNSIGRFITEDPIKDGLNWYAYCGNNPIMFVDPTGLELEMEIYGTISMDGKKYSNVVIHLATVPVQNQLDSQYGDQLCWATCASMLISYYRNENIDRTTEIAIAVAKDELGEWGIKTEDDTISPEVYNVPRPWISTDYIGSLIGLDIDRHQTQYYPANTLTERQIKQQIDNDNPFAMLYGTYIEQPDGKIVLKNGHWCLTIGYIESLDENDAKTFYLRNDPWGGIIQNLTYSELNEYRDNYWTESAY